MNKACFMIDTNVLSQRFCIWRSFRADMTNKVLLFHWMLRVHVNFQITFICTQATTDFAAKWRRCAKSVMFAHMTLKRLDITKCCTTDITQFPVCLQVNSILMICQHRFGRKPIAKLLMWLSEQWKYFFALTICHTRCIGISSPPPVHVSFCGFAGNICFEISFYTRHSCATPRRATSCALYSLSAVWEFLGNGGIWNIRDLNGNSHDPRANFG